VKREIMELGMGCLLLAGIFCFARAGAKMVVNQSADDKITVVVDSGHGGSDPGKIGIHGEQEKDINLQIARKLKEKLEKENIEVVMTREKDKDLADDNAQSRKVQDLKRRCELIHQVKPDCAVSIHQNSYPDESVKGAQVFYYQDSLEGKKLGEVIQEKLIEEVEPENHRQAKGNRSYYLLKKTDAPLAIVECGFLSNPAEAEKLITEEYQEQVAEAVCKGIVDYLEM
jgi:N-acetylmuramoyl-L-alanine amidase